LKNTIKVERAKKGITQADLAEIVGVTRLTIHSIEAGKFKPSLMPELEIQMRQSLLLTFKGKTTL